MKKRVFYSIFLFLIIVTAFVLAGCKTTIDKVNAKKESDGQFYYYYDDKTGGYAVVGDMDSDNAQTLVLPAYFNGKEVRSLFYCYVAGFGYHALGPSLKNVKKLYLPYSCTNGFEANNLPFMDISEIVFTSDTQADLYLDYFHSTHNYSDVLTVYIADEYFDDAEGRLLEYYINKTELSCAIKRYKRKTVFDYYGKTMILVRLNTTFAFNYEGSPNDGVFFVDDFIYGQPVNDTPYYPVRKGYDFTGWYKDPDCSEKWDFGSDALPTVGYDDEGEPTEFVETKIYAGWKASNDIK